MYVRMYVICRPPQFSQPKIIIRPIKGVFINDLQNLVRVRKSDPDINLFVFMFLTSFFFLGIGLLVNFKI